jgi:hypothetical protein
MAAPEKDALMAQLKANYTLLYKNPTNKELQTQFFGVVQKLYGIAPEKRGTRRVSLGGPFGEPLGGPIDELLGRNKKKITPQNDEEETKENHERTVNDYFQGLLIPQPALNRFQLTSCELWQKNDMFLLLLGLPTDLASITTNGDLPLVDLLLEPRTLVINVWIVQQQLDIDPSSDTIENRFGRLMLRNYNGRFSFNVNETNIPDKYRDDSFIQTAINECNDASPDLSSVKNYTDFFDEMKDKNIETKLQETIEFFIEKCPDLKKMFEVEVGGNFICKNLFAKINNPNQNP